MIYKGYNRKYDNFYIGVDITENKDKNCIVISRMIKDKYSIDYILFFNFKNILN